MGLSITFFRLLAMIRVIARLPFRAIPPAQCVPILQGRMRGRKWIAGSGGHVYWLGSYERSLRLLLEATIQEDSVVFDIGAHVGYYTLLCSLLVGRAGSVVAFEPSPRNLVYLKEHLRINQVANARVIEAAVSDRDGTALFDEGRSSFTGALSPHGRLRVRVVSLDGQLADGAIPVPQYMKIAAEGAEVDVLRGAVGILTTARPTLFVSVHGGDSRRRSHEFLSSLGYKITPVEHRTSLQHIVARWNGTVSISAL
jgi:FkbM family methyltransferase